MNIVIIEKGHFEVCYTLLSLFDNGQNKITVFIDGDAYKQMEFMLAEKTRQFNWIIQSNNESNRQFIERIFDHPSLHLADLLYLNTIEDNFIVYAHHLGRLGNKNTVLTVHDINGFFHYRPSLSLRRLVRYVGKRRLIRQITSFNVLSATLVTYLQSKLTAARKIYAIPGSIFDPATYAPAAYSTGDELRIAIPGSVDARRRNYDQLFELLDITSQRGVPVAVVLLGGFKKTHSESILDRCLAYQRKYNNLRFYQEEVVDQPVFDSTIRQCHFLWLPLQPFSIISDGISEQYGRSTSSGNIADAIRYAKPFFVPEWLSLDPELEKSCIRYQAVADIIRLLEQLTPSSFSDLQQKALEAALPYTREQIIARNPGLLA